MRSPSRSFVLAGLAVLYACGGSTSTDTGPAPRADAAADAGIALEDSGAGGTDAAAGDGAAQDAAGSSDAGFPPGPINLTGTFVSRTFSSACWDGTSGKDTVNIITYTKVDSMQNGRVVTNEVEVCAIELTEYRGSRTVYPEAAIRTIPRRSSTTTLMSDSFPAAFIPEPNVTTLGYEPTGDPLTDPVPMDSTDARVRDSDGDGNPGVTVMLMGPLNGSLYIVSRTVTEIDALVLSNDRVEGSSQTTSEQRTLGAMPALLAFGSVTSMRNPDPASSTYALVRLPATVTTCAQIAAMKDALVGPRPTVTRCP